MWYIYVVNIAGFQRKGNASKKNILRSNHKSFESVCISFSKELLYHYGFESDKYPEPDLSHTKNMYLILANYKMKKLELIPWPAPRLTKLESTKIFSYYYPRKTVYNTMQ